MENFNSDPKPGRLILPLILIGMISTTYTFINRVSTNNSLEVVDVYRKQGNRTGGLGKTAGLSIHNGRLAVSNFDGRKIQIFDLPS